MLTALTKTLRHIVKNIPLRWALTLPFVLPTVGATVLVGYLSYRSGQEAVANLGQQLVAETNERVTQELQSYLQTPILINRLNVDAVNQGHWSLQNTSALEAALFSRSQQFEQVSAILFINPQGTFRLVERRPKLYLISADPPDPDLLRVYRLDQQGKRGAMVYTVNGLDVRRDRPWYRQAVASGQPGWSSIAQYGSSEALTLNASQPVYDQTTNNLLGVFAVHVRLDYLSNFLRRLDVSRSGRVIVVDQNGALVATSTEAPINQTLPRTTTNRAFKQFNMSESQDDLTRSLGQYLRDRPDLKSLDQSHSFEFDYKGERQYIRLTPFRDRYGLNWQVLTIIPKSHFTSAIQSNVQTTALLCLLTLGIALMLGLLIDELLLSRFAQINRASRELAAGNLNQRLAIDQPISELNSLARAFNQMANQLQQSFNRSEARYRAIVEDQTEMIARSLPDGTLVFVNDAYCRYFGLQREDIIGKSYRSFIYADDQTRVAQLIDSLSMTNPILIVENRVVVNGTACWTQWVDRILFDEQGNVTEMQSVGRDITALKQTEQALRTSEANLLQAQRIAHVGSWEFDLTTQKITWSEELFRIFGRDLAQSEPTYTELMEMVPVAERNALATAIRQAITEGTPYEIEHCVCRPDGTVRYIVSKGQAELNDQQQVLKLYGTALDITDRREVRLALQESETRFRQLAEAVREGFFVFEVESSHYSYVNPSCERITGLPYAASKEEAYFSRGMSHWFNSIYPDDRPQIEAALQREREGENFNQEYRFIRPDGELRWLRSQAFPIHDPEGSIVRIVGTVDDITERKQLEQSLRSQAEEEHLLARITQKIRQSLELDKILATTVIEVQQTLNADRVLIFRLNFDGSGQVIQEAVVPDYAITEQMHWQDEHFPEECYEYYRSGKPRIVPDVAMDAWADCLIEFMQQIGVKSKIVAPILQTRGKSFAKVWGLLVVHSCADYRHWQQREADFLQQICNQLAIAIDQSNLYQQLQVELAERKQAEAALKASEERFRRAFDDAPIGISLISPDGEFLRVNTCYCNLLGYDEAELLNLTFQQITHPGDLETDIEGLRQMLSGEISSFQMEKRYITKQGTIVPVLVNVAPIRDQDGHPLYLVGHVRDVRDRLKVERMKDEFISVVSHELRTPLTSIQGALGILGSGIFSQRPEKANHMLQIAINNSDRLVRLVNDILSLERLESGKIQLVMELCQVTDLMQQAIDSVQPIADQSAINLSVTPVAQTLWAAPDAVVQTLTNLLSNAIKFSSPGDTVWLKAEVREEFEVETQELENTATKAVLTRTHPTLPPRPHTQFQQHVSNPNEHTYKSDQFNPLSQSAFPYLLLTVKDHGRGIPSDSFDTIFEQFQQVDVSDSRKKGGTGLGLAICRNIVQQHNGQIWVESTLGKGSTFYVALPLRMRGDHA